MTRKPGELPPEEEALLGIERPTPEQEEEAEKLRKEKADLRRAFLRAMLDNELFREWLMEQLVGFGTFENAFGAGPTGFPDKLATQFAQGMKAAGWHLWTMFDDVAPESASLMRREYGKPKP
jgi:hypothetical protein